MDLLPEFVVGEQAVEDVLHGEAHFRKQGCNRVVDPTTTLASAERDRQGIFAKALLDMLSNVASRGCVSGVLESPDSASLALLVCARHPVIEAALLVELGRRLVQPDKLVQGGVPESLCLI